MRRSFFLLEVMIAVALIGLFAAFSLRGCWALLSSEEKSLQAIEYQRLKEAFYMQMLERHHPHWGRYAEQQEILEESTTLESPWLGVLSPPLRVRISCQRQNGHMLVTVSDGGPPWYYCADP